MSLNHAQLQAVYHTKGACLVLAGAGSGKTRVITHKIAHLIQHERLAPQSIAAITFTNKAAAEMRQRCTSLVGKQARGSIICTFHALGVRMLRQDGELLGLKPSFSILDSQDALAILKDCAGGAATDPATLRQWQWEISSLKGQAMSAEEALSGAKDEHQRQIALIMQRYQERLSAYQSLDFDDLITLPLRLLQTQSEARQRWQQSLAHILIDEYQDTNAAQYELLKLLTGTDENARFTAVGDDDQSIYGWRGATLENLKKLPSDFPDLAVIKLEQNYRSTNAILQAANNVIGPNPKLFPKRLFSELGQGEAVQVLECDNEEHEAQRAVRRIQLLRSSTRPTPPWSSFAILYRTNFQSKPFEKALRQAAIPYRVSGGSSFFDRSEIKDLCAWFRLISNSDDDPAFVRSITTPRQGIGHTTLARLGEFAHQHKTSMFGALFNQMLPAVLPKTALDRLLEFGRNINDLEYRARRTMGAQEGYEFLLEWLKEIGYEQYLYDGEDNSSVAAARWNNVLEFCQWMAQRAGGQLDDSEEEASSATGLVLHTQPKSLLEVAQNVALLSTLSERESEQDQVTLSTLHASKGLEWTHVQLAGLVQGVLPLKVEDEDDAAENPEHLQEERRLMYVGITRAQKTLVVSWPRRRKKGRGDSVPCNPSCFIEEMKLQQSSAGSSASSSEGKPPENPREKLLRLRQEFAERAAAAAAKSY